PARPSPRFYRSRSAGPAASAPRNRVNLFHSRRFHNFFPPLLNNLRQPAPEFLTPIGYSEGVEAYAQRAPLFVNGDWAIRSSGRGAVRPGGGPLFDNSLWAAMERSGKPASIGGRNS